MANTLILLILIGLIGWLWVDAMRSRETATAACRDLCRSYDVQFLDDTVSLTHLALSRTPGRGLLIRRVYQFEISHDGTARRRGSITLLGNTVQAIFLPEDPTERPT